MTAGSKIFFSLFFIASLFVIVYLYQKDVFKKHDLITYNASSTYVSNGNGNSQNAGADTSGNSYQPWYETWWYGESQGNASASDQSSFYWTGTYGTNSVDIPQGFTLEQLSPYFQKVSINSVWAVSFGSYGQISLTSWFEGDGGIDLTGWSLQNNKKNRMFIPRGVSARDPYGSNNQERIILKSGDFLSLYSSTSSLGKFGIHLNKCMGYFQNAFDFNPPFSWWCPYDINRSEISALSGKCQDYILSLNACTEPDLNHEDIVYDSDCRAYLVDLNYAGCFKKHQDDADFYEREWRAWMADEFLELDERHDRVFLYDVRGLLVDEYTY